MLAKDVREDKQEIIRMIIQMENTNFLDAIYWFVRRLSEEKKHE